MAKIGAIGVDNRILDAARDGTLVVFAGAGVSMGPPSNLPGFEELAAYVAGVDISAIEKPLDRFLGHLRLRGIAVHKRAAERLSMPDSRPKELHRDLLRIFATIDRVRIVTTNFDPHFGSAAIEVFGQMPDLYRAPALPRGDDFVGIVHVHGALTHPRGLVLTDEDFGRAYLTEGWARRFLVDVFRRYTVLFVGYSHDDVVMNYLARALPADSIAGRFALTDTEGNWTALGITPVKFAQAAEGNPFRELEEGVHKLAALASRGVLDWQRRLSELGSAAPPLDDEAADEIEQALTEVHNTRFLLRATRDPQWLRWLGARGQLDALFQAGQLSERDTTLLMWVTENFVLENAEDLFELIARNRGRMNPALWRGIATTIGLDQGAERAASSLRQWVAILLAARPHDVPRDDLAWLAKRCDRAGEDALVLQIFIYLCQHELRLTPNNMHATDGQQAHRRLDADVAFGCDVHALSELWSDHVKPTLSAHAYDLLSAMTRSLGAIYRDLTTWDDTISTEWDPHCFHRSAIEPHEQDRFPEPIDVLVDAARDALEHLADTRPLLVDAWLESVDMQVPLLRRLAIHATTKHCGLTPEDRLKWVLEHVGLTGPMEHHEVFIAVALSYPKAGDQLRKVVVDAIMAIEVEAASEWSAEKMTDWAHFAWLSWLLQASPDCPYAQAALTPIEQRHPEWEPEEHPEFTHYSGTISNMSSESPWPAERLLASPAQGQLDQLLAFQGTRAYWPGRSGLLSAVTTACKQQPRWAIELLSALLARDAYSSDLWGAVLRGLRDTDLSTEEWGELLAIAGQPEVQTAQPAPLADLLYEAVREGATPLAPSLLAQANNVAFNTWQAIDGREIDNREDDWTWSAHNRPAGIIVQFWLLGLSRLMHSRTGDARFLPDDYKHWFESVIREPGSKGGYGRVLLAAQVSFLYGLDEVWTREHVVRLFSDQEPSTFAQAWDGFLASGRLPHALAADMAPAFAAALARIDQSARRRRRLIEFYAALAVYYVDDPERAVLPDLLRLGSVSDRVAFVVQVGTFLRAMEPAAARALWDRWLREYWTLRLDAVGAPLDDAENAKMLDWLPYLGDAFVQAVDLAVQAPRVTADHSGLLMALRESDLVLRFPEATARLLIYVCDRLRSYLVADVGRIAARLSNLPTELDLRLREQLARVGAT